MKIINFTSELPGFLSNFLLLFLIFLQVKQFSDDKIYLQRPISLHMPLVKHVFEGFDMHQLSSVFKVQIVILEIFKNPHPVSKYLHMQWKKTRIYQAYRPSNQVV